MSLSHRKLPFFTSFGFGLVEVMVSLAIGMLGMLVMYQVFANAEEHKRTTTSGNDAQGNAVAAMLALEQDIRMAGYGFNAFPGFGGNNPVLGCVLKRYHSDATPQEATFTLAPLLIMDGGSRLSDTIIIAAGAPSALPSPVGFEPLATGAGYTLNRAADQIAFNVGDLILAFEQGKNCVLRQMTSKSGMQNEVLNHIAGESAPFNNPSGVGESYSAPNPQLLNLGNAGQMRLRRYSIESDPNSTLSVRDLLTGSETADNNRTEVADEIVNLQAQYGVDTGSGNSLEWKNPVDDWAYPLDKDAMQHVRAVRIAVVARSARQEREQDADGACTTTTVAPISWAGGPSIDLSETGDWQCYRYRVMSTIIPLRNVLWGET